MYQLSATLAQEIVDRMMKDIPYNINIMNERGIIIGSGNATRIGTVHKGAVKALASGQMVEVWEDKQNEKKGTNEPIVIGHDRIGVIGISGNPEEVRPFCNIVRTTVVLLIEQGLALQTMQNEANRKRAFLEVLLHHQGPYTQKLKKEALAHGLDLLLPTTVVYARDLDVSNLLQSNVLLLHPAFMIDDDCCLILVQDVKEVKAVLKQLLQTHSNVKVSVSRHEVYIADGYDQARGAMSVYRSLKLPERITLYEETEFLVELSQSELSGSEQLITKLEDKESADLLDTLRTFIYHNGSVSATSSELNIHRNSLQYRLKRIHDLTGKDPRNMLQLFQLTYGILIRYK
ncbi:carbohydrate diacid regulator [Paenibacillaceae bacterium GAS479]|nr:carbohydrate diacid regulator [Paenibacillaceae bacterium GAS479]